MAKRPDSVYESGQRSGAWVKVKLTQAQEVVIGGYTPPGGSRMYFGSLLVGYYDSSGLLFAGRVRTGFSEKVLEVLYDGLQKIRRATCPFVNLPERRSGRWGQGITPAVMKRCSLGRVLGSVRSVMTGGAATPLDGKKRRLRCGEIRCVAKSSGSSLIQT
jgi:bifunctional non-homologous end joining protein LigD